MQSSNKKDRVAQHLSDNPILDYFMQSEMLWHCYAIEVDNHSYLTHLSIAKTKKCATISWSTDDYVRVILYIQGVIQVDAVLCYKPIDEYP